MIKVQLLVHWV